MPMYGAYNNAPSGSKTFIQQVIEYLNDRLGGTTGNLKPLYARIASVGACKFGTTVGKKLADAYASQGMKAYDLLLPVTSDCVVQWACVVEPLVELGQIQQVHSLKLLSIIQTLPFIMAAI